MLCKEKDELLAEYGIVHCTAEQFKDLPSGAIKHKKETPYGVEAMVVRGDIPSNVSISPISIEEIFVFMVKEAR